MQRVITVLVLLRQQSGSRRLNGVDINGQNIQPNPFAVEIAEGSRLLEVGANLFHPFSSIWRRDRLIEFSKADVFVIRHQSVRRADLPELIEDSFDGREVKVHKRQRTYDDVVASIRRKILRSSLKEHHLIPYSLVIRTLFKLIFERLHKARVDFTDGEDVAVFKLSNNRDSD